MKTASRFTLATACLAIGAVGGVFVSEHLQLKAQPQLRPAAVIPRELTSYRDIVKEVAPAVVSIEARKKVISPKVMMAPRPEAEVVPTQGPKNDVQLGFGSGVLIDPKGVILTNFHVVDGADSLEIRLPDGRKFSTTDWRADRKSDLAIIRVQSDKPLPALQFGDSDLMEVGDRVLAIGAPFGLTGSVTHGIISAKSRNIRLNQYEDFLQTDAAINPGNSGGPLVSLDGKVIGLNSAIKSKTGGFQGVGLAISSNLAKTVVEKLLTEGAVKRGYLGIKIRDIDAELATKLAVREASGVLITSVVAQSPAAKCGLKVNDIVITIAGKPIRDGIELQKVVGDLPLYQAVDVVLKRDGVSLQLRLTIEEQPDEFGDGAKKRKQ
jgi:serine protease Do